MGDIRTEEVSTQGGNVQKRSKYLQIWSIFSLIAQVPWKSVIDGDVLRIKHIPGLQKSTRTQGTVGEAAAVRKYRGVKHTDRREGGRGAPGARVAGEGRGERMAGRAAEKGVGPRGRWKGSNEGCLCEDSGNGRLSDRPTAYALQSSERTLATLRPPQPGRCFSTTACRQGGITNRAFARIHV